jgi:two-component system sensor histidine kinase VicK
MKINFFKNTSITVKLLMGLLSGLIFLGSFGFYLSSSLSRGKSTFIKIADQYDVLNAISISKVNIVRLSEAAEAYVLTEDPKWEKIYQESLTEYNQAFIKLKTFERDTEDFILVDELESLTNDLRQVENLVLAKVRDGEAEQAVELFNARYRKKRSEVTLLLTKYVEQELEEMAEILRVSDETVTTIRKSVVIFLSIAGGMSVLSMILVTSAVSGPIKRLTRTVEQISAGNLRKKARVAGKDEVGRLALAFNNMTDKLQKTLGELEREKMRLLASIKSSPIGFGIIGKAGVIEIKNSVFRKQLSDCMNLQDLHNKLKKSVNFYDKYEDAVNKNKTIELEEIVYNDKFLRIIISPIIGNNNSKKTLGAIILVENITEAKLLERSKNEFFAVASHEMRSPLTAIKNNAAFFRDQYLKDIKNKDAAEVLDDIYDSSVSLMNLADNFLNTSRLEMGEMKFAKEEVDFPKVIKEVVEEVDILANKKGLYIKVKVGDKIPKAFGDQQRIKEIIYNLLSNAINYTRKGGVVIRISLKDNNLEVRFIDTGIGISVQNQKLLFQKFQQAGEDMLTREKSSSAGLGLYISRLLARGMKGEVALEKSSLGKGSTFIFTIPVAKETKRV